MLYQKFIKPIDAKSLSSNDKNIENANDFHFSVWEVNDVYAKLTLWCLVVIYNMTWYDMLSHVLPGWALSGCQLIITICSDGICF